MVSRTGGGATGVASEGNSGATCGTVKGGLTFCAIIEGAAEACGGVAKFAAELGGMDPLSIGGKGPDGKCGVTREARGPAVTAAAGAAIGAGASLGAVTIDGSEPPDMPPETASGATQPTAPPPLVPEQLHVQGPAPLTALEMPAEHNPLFGVISVGNPFAGPQFPVTGAGGIREAVQLTVMPPFWPRQFQFQGPLPLTAVAVPLEHSPSIGCTTAATPLAPPQSPLTERSGGGGAGGIVFRAEQDAAMPPLNPEHVHVHGPSP